MVAERPRLGWLQTGGLMPLDRQILSDPKNRVPMEERRYPVHHCRKQTPDRGTKPSFASTAVKVRFRLNPTFASVGRLIEE